MPQTLQLILLLLAAAVVVVVACRLLRLPPILGYLVVGIAVGPHALAWVPDNADVRDLAEFGIVFLMFSIGLEFSLPQLKAMRRAVFGLGLAQVAITTVAAMIAPCSVKTFGRYLRCWPRPAFKVAICDLKELVSSAVS